MGAALRGTGNFKPGMVVQTATVIINMVLAPVLMFGWVTGAPLGVAGAAIATLLAIVLGTVWLLLYFLPADAVPAVRARRTGGRSWRLWKRHARHRAAGGRGVRADGGLPVHRLRIARPFGAAAQAGFGIGMRIMQAAFMPVVALGFAVAPVAGQNFGARQRRPRARRLQDGGADRRRVMLVLTVLCHFAPARDGRRLLADPRVDRGRRRSICASCRGTSSPPASCSSAASMFQAMGNTLPVAGRRRSCASSSSPCRRRCCRALPGFELRWIWYLAVASVALQMLLNCCCSAGNSACASTSKPRHEWLRQSSPPYLNKADQEREGGDADDRQLHQPHVQCAAQQVVNRELMNANAVAVSTCHGRSTATGAVRRLAGAQSHCWTQCGRLDPVSIGRRRTVRQLRDQGKVARPAGLEPATSCS